MQRRGAPDRGQAGAPEPAIERAPHGRHALSRPGPRDRRRPAAGRDLDGRRRAELREAASRSAMPRPSAAPIPGARRRDHELDAHRARRRDRQRCRKSPPQPAEQARRGAIGSRRSSTRLISDMQGRVGLSSRTTCASAARIAGPGRSSPRTQTTTVVPASFDARASARIGAILIGEGRQHERQRSRCPPSACRVMWNRLIAVVEEQAQTLIRTAFSTSTREAGDLSAGVFDPTARMLAQAVTGTPGHVNSMAASVDHFLDKFPAAHDEGQATSILTNDPWKGTGHLHDFTVVTPTFRRGKLVALFASTCARRRYRRPRHGRRRPPGLRGRPLHPAHAASPQPARSTRHLIDIVAPTCASRSRWRAISTRWRPATRSAAAA